MDLAITDATVWTGTTEPPGLLRDTTVGIEGDTIAFVGRLEGLSREPDRIIDGDELLVTPGLIDAHAHTTLRLATGLAQDVPEAEWMDRALGPVSRAMACEDRHAGARLGILEAMRSGVTTIAEYATAVGDLVEAVHLPAGLRVVAIETINEVAARDDDGTYDLDRSAGSHARHRGEALFERMDRHDRATAMYGPQALDMVTEETLLDVASRAQEHDRRLCMHVAQGKRERAQLRARFGVDSAVELLEAHEWIDDHLVAVHLHGATQGERDRLASRGVALVGCPSSIIGIDGVIPPIAAYRDAGGLAAVGSDQAPGGGGGHALLGEVRLAWLSSKLARGDPTALPAWEALRLATTDAARVLDLDDHVGTVEVGKRADLACFDRRSGSLTPSPTVIGATPLVNLVSGGGGQTVSYLIVDGELVVDDGEMCTVDPASATQTAIDRATSLHEHARTDWLAADSTLVGHATNGPFSVE